MPPLQNPSEARAGRLRDPVLVLALSCMMALGWLIGALVGAEDIDDVFSESGPLERVSAFFLMLSAGALAWDMGRRRDWTDWHMALLALAAAMRELDWDKAFTDSGILSLRLYSGAASPGQKIIGGLIVVLLVWAGLRLVRRDLAPWWRSLRQGRIAAWLMLVVLGLYAVAKSLDGLGRKLAPWGIDLSEWVDRVASRSEEGLELIAVILLLQAVMLRPGWRVGVQPDSTDPRPSTAMVRHQDQAGRTTGKAAISAADRGANSSAERPR